MKNREPLNNTSGLTLDLLGKGMEEGEITYDPSWLADAWILDHPYRSNIFNRHWDLAIYISQGAGRLSVIGVKFVRHLRQRYSGIFELSN